MTIVSIQSCGILGLFEWFHSIWKIWIYKIFFINSREHFFTRLLAFYRIFNFFLFSFMESALIFCRSDLFLNIFTHLFLSLVYILSISFNSMYTPLCYKRNLLHKTKCFYLADFDFILSNLQNIQLMARMPSEEAYIGFTIYVRRHWSLRRCVSVGYKVLAHSE